MNKAGGFIVIHRQMLDWEWHKNPNTLSMFIHLLLMANYEEGRFEGKVIGRGQLATSIHSLSEETGLSFQQTRTALEHLILTGEITNKSYTKYRVITITNYDKYQDKQQTRQQTNNKQVTSNLTNNQQQYNNITNINKETNKENSPTESKRKAQPFVPPTVEEIEEYCRKRNNGIDPEYFFDYQEARNWTLKGGQKIKNWQAVIRTWERNGKEKKDGLQHNVSGRDYGDDKGSEGEHRSKYAWLRDTVIRC